MKLKSKVLAVGSALAMAAFATSANAAVVFDGLGYWSAGTPTTALSKEGKKFSFSFTLQDEISANPTSDIANFTYSFGGSTYEISGATIKFDPDLFTISFGDVSAKFYGADVYPDGPFVTPGFSLFSMDVNVGSSFFATGTGYTQLTSIADIPEPATWGMMVLGLAAVGYSLRQRRQQNVTFGGYAVA